MSIEQRALIIRVGPAHTNGLDELNVELQQGWRVVKVTPLGGTGLDEHGDASVPFLAALVVIERRQRKDEPPVAVKALEKIKEVEDEPKEVVEENGTSPLKNPSSR